MLARTLGRTLSELDESMSIDEFNLWLAEYNRSPWGTVREIALEMQLAEFACMWLNSKQRKGARALKPRDFMKIRSADDGGAQSNDEYEDLLQFVRAVNG